MGQIVMTVFYGVDPSHVRKQTGDFGKAFKETCARKTKEKEERWSQALEYVGNIEGEHFLNWVNEADMIEKIATDVSNKLNATPAKDFDGMVGFEAHLREMESLLDLDNDEVKMVAITGPAGIGKSSIARALHSLLSNRFQLTCFVDNLRGTYPIGLDEYGLKFRLQEELLSKTLNQSSMRICHLGVIEERLHDQKVLIILDDVNNIKQLEALAGDSSWFGPGSRVVVRTENKELLQQHGINNTYHVKFPSRGEALQIFCRYAFRQTYPHDHFEELALKVTALCGNLPLGLRVVGSSLRGKKVDEWEDVMDRLETILDHQDIEQVLRVGYESLHEKEQSLFLHIAVFFSCKYGDLVKAMFADNNSDIKHGLKILANKSLIYLSEDGKIVMHKLLHVGTKVVHKEKPWKRRILTDAQVISDVLERAKGTRDVSGISFDISEIDEVFLSPKAFKRMPNLRFLKIYKSKDSGNDIFHIPDEMVFPRGLRLLHWEACPSKSLPLGFCLENLVELHMPHSHLEKLWEGTQPLTNLKKMNLSWSSKLKELPDLSNAASFERLELFRCESLVEIHSSIGNLQSIDFLQMGCCTKLQVVPALFNLAPHAYVSVEGCSQLRNIPDFSRNIRAVVIADTMIKELPRSVSRWSALYALTIYGHSANIDRIPDCIKELHGLVSLWVYGCSKIASVPELPASIKRFTAECCESLKTVSLPFDSEFICDINKCFKLGRDSRRVIKKSLRACLPGSSIPSEFDHQAEGNSLTIRSDFSEYRFCAVVFPKQQIEESFPELFCRICVNKGCPTDHNMRMHLRSIHVVHLCFSYADLLEVHGWLEQENEITFEFITCQGLEIIECGVQIMTEESKRSRRIEFDEASKACQDSQDGELMDRLICYPKEKNNG
ncbi:hypothetical protein Bca4012_061096 [Brassica carinata]